MRHTKKGERAPTNERANERASDDDVVSLLQQQQQQQHFKNGGRFELSTMALISITMIILLALVHPLSFNDDSLKRPQATPMNQAVWIYEGELVSPVGYAHFTVEVDIVTLFTAVRAVAFHKDWKDATVKTDNYGPARAHEDFHRLAQDLVSVKHRSMALYARVLNLHNLGKSIVVDASAPEMVRGTEPVVVYPSYPLRDKDLGDNFIMEPRLTEWDDKRFTEWDDDAEWIPVATEPTPEATPKPWAPKTSSKQEEEEAEYDPYAKYDYNSPDYEPPTVDPEYDDFLGPIKSDAPWDGDFVFTKGHWLYHPVSRETKTKFFTTPKPGGPTRRTRKTDSIVRGQGCNWNRLRMPDMDAEDTDVEDTDKVKRQAAAIAGVLGPLLVTTLFAIFKHKELVRIRNAAEGLAQEMDLTATVLREHENALADLTEQYNNVNE
ncbi:MAG: hypothetical protein IH921_09530, partial [Gemmatimonadetes bacterium]|nr:hypothetical protein [Gemmatimonadota bacterium]